MILEIFGKFIVFCLFKNLFKLKFMKLNMYDGNFWEVINFSEMILVKILERNLDLFFKEVGERLGYIY